MKTKHSPNKDIFVVNHPEQLLHIVEEAVVKKVVLQLPSLALNEISYWENQLTAEKNACGCGEGAAFLLIMLAGQAILIFTKSPLLPESTVATVFLCTAIAFMSIAIGKTFGRYRATIRLNRSIHDLIIVLNNRLLYPRQNDPEGEVS